MRCLACNVALSEKEQQRKYKNWKEIPNPEARYINLCDSCLNDGELDDMDLVQHHFHVNGTVIPNDS